jgi:hypothetical protein
VTHLRQLLVVPLVASSLLVAGCFELEGTIDDVLGGPEMAELPELSEDTDPEVQAAAESSDEVAKEKEAQRAMQQALDNNQLDAALEAVELRPRDPYYHVQFAALLMANGDDANARTEFLTAGGIMHAEEFSDAEKLEVGLVAELEVRDSFAPDSEQWNRLNQDYCKTLDAYRKVAPQDDRNVLDTIFDIAEFPDESCP